MKKGICAALIGALMVGVLAACANNMPVEAMTESVGDNACSRGQGRAGWASGKQ